ncbi:MAG: alpha/beta fold hydrolase [Gemmatimonadota bacterium]
MRFSVATLAALVPSPVLAAQEFPTLAPDAPTGSGEVRECAIGGAVSRARCGRYRVWEDREAASGRTVDLAFVVLDATGPDPAEDEVVIPLPGGPGEAFTRNAAGISRAAAGLLRSRDILLVDVRGVGRSQTLDCPPFEIDLADRFGTVFPPEHIRMCRDALSERARLDLYTTNHSVDDLDELRRWLGYEAVNLSGTSYGTRVAQVYMRRHPDAIRTVTLNSVAPVFQLGYVHMARSLQRSLDLVVAACAGSPECAAENPELRARLDEVLDRLDRAPAELEIEGVPVAFTKGDFSYALRGLLYGRADVVPEVIQRAYDGDFERVARYYLQRAGWVGGEGGEAGYHFSALCAEDIHPLTDEEVARLSAGTFMGDHLIAGYRDVCRVWGAARLPESFWEPVRSDLPVLIISGERDPVTPPAWGDAVAAYLPNSLHVVVPGGGHGPGNACTDALETRFLETGSVEGLDPSCVGETAPRGSG